jgi:hypothetical protein
VNKWLDLLKIWEIRLWTLKRNYIKWKNRKNMNGSTIFNSSKCTIKILCLKLEFRESKEIASSMTWSLDRTVTDYGFQIRLSRSILKIIAFQTKSSKRWARNYTTSITAPLIQKYFLTLSVHSSFSKRTLNRGKMSGDLSPKRPGLLSKITGSHRSTSCSTSSRDLFDY